MSSSRTRITPQQRRLMLDFIKSNPSLATGRFDGPDGVRVRSRLLAVMANILNSQGSGATKTPEKWLRSWQDWKSDVKKKAAVIARHSRGTGGGPSSSDLTELEKDLVVLIGPTSISGLEVPDPLESPREPEMPEVTIEFETEPQSQLLTKPQSQLLTEPRSQLLTESQFQLLSEPQPQLLIESQFQSVTEPQSQAEAFEDPQRPKKRKRSDDIDEQMISALQKQADSTAEIARQLGRLAEVGQLFYNYWRQLQNTDSDGPGVEREEHPL